MLLAAAVLVIGIGLVHSWLGEKYILMRLFRQTLPALFGDDRFTRQTLRFAWHLLSVSWFGLAAIVLLTEFGEISRTNLLTVVSGTFAVTALVAFVVSRGKHLSWIVFTTIAALCLLGG